MTKLKVIEVKGWHGQRSTSIASEICKDDLRFDLVVISDINFHLHLQYIYD